MAAFEAVGCAACNNSGFKGRTAIGEGFLASEALLRAVADRSTPSLIAEIARGNGLSGMAADGVGKAILGETTFEEVMAAVNG